MATTKDFSPKAPDEQIYVTFDFTSSLEAGETVSTAAVTSTVAKGFDPSASSVVSGIPTVSSPLVQVLLVGGVLNNVYNIKCSATTNLGQKLDIIGVLTIND